jgi:D-sedoheptulose 7-phosphate isomerase
MFKRRLEALDSSLHACHVDYNGVKLDVDQGLSQAAHLIRATQKESGIVYVIGNGGSAGIASHFSNDLVKALQIPSQTLYDSNLMTCLANDLGYEHVFSFPLKRLLKPNDLLVAISSSGKSANILNGADVALETGARLITLSGFLVDNPLRVKGQLNFWIGQIDYGLVETSHFFLLHTMIDLWPQFSLNSLLKCGEYAKTN